MSDSIRIPLEVVDQFSRTLKKFEVVVDSAFSKATKSVDNMARTNKVAKNSLDQLNKEAGKLQRQIVIDTKAIGDKSKAVNYHAARIKHLVGEYQRMGVTAPQALQKMNNGLEKTASSSNSVTNSLAGLKSALAGFVTVSAFKQLAERATQIAPLASGFDNLTKSIDTTSDALLSKLHRATNGMISDMDLMKMSNNAIILGVARSSEQFSQLAGDAVKLGRAVGLDATTAIESLVTGIGRQSRMMLDNLGIIVKAEAAYERYAQKLGKTADELTENERKLAFNEAAMEGVREAVAKLSDQSFPVDKWTQLQVEFQNQIDKFVQSTAFVDALAAASDYITAAADGVETLVSAISDLGKVTGIGSLNEQLHEMDLSIWHIAIGIAMIPAAPFIAIALGGKYVYDEFIKTEEVFKANSEELKTLSTHLKEVWGVDMKLFNSAVEGLADATERIQSASSGQHQNLLKIFGTPQVIQELKKQYDQLAKSIDENVLAGVDLSVMYDLNESKLKAQIKQFETLGLELPKHLKQAKAYYEEKQRAAKASEVLTAKLKAEEEVVISLTGSMKKMFDDLANNDKWFDDAAFAAQTYKESLEDLQDSIDTLDLHMPEMPVDTLEMHVPEVKDKFDSVAREASKAFIDGFTESMRNMANVGVAIGVGLGEAVSAGIKRAIKNANIGGYLGDILNAVAPVAGSIVSSIFGGLFGGGESDAERAAKLEKIRQDYLAKTNEMMQEFIEKVKAALESGESFAETLWEEFITLSSRGADFTEVLETINATIEEQKKLIEETEKAIAEFPDKLYDMRIGLDDMRRSLRDLKREAREMMRDLKDVWGGDSFTFDLGGGRTAWGATARAELMAALKQAQSKTSKLGARISLKEEREILRSIDDPAVRAAVEQLIAAKNQLAAQKLAIERQKTQIKLAREAYYELRNNLPKMKDRLAEMVKFQSDMITAINNQTNTHRTIADDIIAAIHQRNGITGANGFAGTFNGPASGYPVDVTMHGMEDLYIVPRGQSLGGPSSVTYNISIAANKVDDSWLKNGGEVAIANAIERATKQGRTNLASGISSKKR